MKKLIPMADFVIIQNIRLANKEINHNECGLSILKYANFLKKPLTIGMFLPVDEDGNVLEEPREDDYSFYTHNNKSVHEEYSEAKERVLFEFQLEYLSWDNSDMENNTIEDLLTDGYDYTLTPYALKQIGL